MNRSGLHRALQSPRGHQQLPVAPVCTDMPPSGPDCPREWLKRAATMARDCTGTARWSRVLARDHERLSSSTITTLSRDFIDWLLHQ